MRKRTKRGPYKKDVNHPFRAGRVPGRPARAVVPLNVGPASHRCERKRKRMDKDRLFDAYPGDFPTGSHTGDNWPTPEQRLSRPYPKRFRCRPYRLAIDCPRPLGGGKRPTSTSRPSGMLRRIRANGANSARLFPVRLNRIQTGSRFTRYFQNVVYKVNSCAPVRHCTS